MLVWLLEVTRTAVVTGLLAFLPFRPGGSGPPPETGESPVVPLWSHGAPGFESKKDLPQTVVNGNLASIHNPSLTVFLPEAGHETGAGVIILPGGGHRFLVMEKEGTTVAKWLAAHGIAGFVLKYRLAREAGSAYRIEVEALQDAQRAMRLVRSRATEWKIDPARVGVLGFSAGGELAALVSMRYDGGVANARDPVDRQSCKPAFQALIYPGASQNIVPTKESPPAFLAAGVDDRADISEGVARTYVLFKQVAVPAELHIYAGTGHGFGLRPGPSAGWIARFSEWIAEPTVSRKPSGATAIPRAFPGAEGWAAGTPGGRGGRIIHVTTLAGQGTGSFVDALAEAGPRIVVFDVGGAIDLGAQKLVVRDPFLTIAGQTAPSPGITLIRGGITVETHDVVIRHIRVRPGQAGFPRNSGWEVDAIATGTGAHDVIIDHCSTSWATDENLSASGKRFTGSNPREWREATSHQITFSNCIVAEGLSESTHKKGEHSKGSLIHDNATAIAIIGNLYFSNVDRNPLFKGGARGIVVNNYIHNPGKTAIKYNLLAKEWEGNPYEKGQIAVVGNIFTYGPNTPAGIPLVFVGGQGPCEVYLEGNIAKDARGADVPLLGGSSANTVTIRQRPFWPEGYTPHAAGSLRDHIAKDVGARPWDRDAIDTRIVREALSGGGRIIDSEQDVGGYPSGGETRTPFNADEWDLASMTRKAPR